MGLIGSYQCESSEGQTRSTGSRFDKSTHRGLQAPHSASIFPVRSSEGQARNTGSRLDKSTHWALQALHSASIFGLDSTRLGRCERVLVRGHYVNPHRLYHVVKTLPARTVLLVTHSKKQSAFEIALSSLFSEGLGVSIFRTVATDRTDRRP